MKKGRTRRGIVLGLLLGLLVSGTVLAASYSATVTVTESSSNNYAQLPISYSVNNTYLAASGFTGSEGLDTRMLSGPTELSHMVVSDRTLFTSPITGGTQHLFSYTTGGSNLTSFHIIPGYDGYITTTDNDTLELGDNFTVEMSGWVNTDSGSGKNLVAKPGAFRTFISGTGNITSTTGAAGSENYTAGDNNNIGIFGVDWEAQTFELPIDGIVVSIFIYAADTAGTVDVVAGIRGAVGDLPVGGDLTSGSVSSGTWAGLDWYEIDVDNYMASGGTRYALVIRAPTGDGANNISWRQDTTTAAYGNGRTCSSDNSGVNWTGWDARDFLFDIEYVATYVTATGVSSGEHTIATTFIPTLLSNGGYEVGDPPTDWAAYNVLVAQESTITKVGSKSIKVTANGGPYCRARQLLTNHAYYQGRQLTAGVWAYAMSTNDQVNVLAIRDGLTQSMSSQIPNDEAWHWVSVTKTIDAAAPEIEVQVWVSTAADNDDVVYFDNAILVLDDSCPIGGNFVISIDGESVGLACTENTTLGVPDTSGNWTWMVGNSLAYADNVTMTIDGSEVLKYEPEAYIRGTNLPDLAGSTQNGTFTWGTNPTGVTVSVGALLPYTPSVAEAEVGAEVPEFAPTTEDIGAVTTPGVEGEGFPFYYIFKDLLGQWQDLGGPDISMPYFWKIVAVVVGWLFGTAVMLTTRNIFFGIIAYFIGFAVPAGAMGGVLDLWVPVVYGLGAIATGLLVAKWGASSL